MPRHVIEVPSERTCPGNSFSSPTLAALFCRMERVARKQGRAESAVEAAWPVQFVADRPESRGTGASPTTLTRRSTVSHASRLPPMFARNVLRVPVQTQAYSSGHQRSRAAEQVLDLGIHALDI